jgi:uncharacterized protein (DUF885 family)
MRKSRWILAAALAATFPIVAAAAPAWVVRSNQLSESLIDMEGRYDPVSAASNGAEPFDLRVADLAPGAYERRLADYAAQRRSLLAQRDRESDAKVRQDVDIMVAHIDQRVDALEVEYRFLVAYHEPAEYVYTGLRVLLDPRNKPVRQAKARQLLARYVGAEKGFEPVTALLRARMEADLARPGLIGPYVAQVEQGLANTDRYLRGIRELFERAGIPGWEGDWQQLARQLREHDAWVRSTLLPRARTEARLPREVYAERVRESGVSISPESLMSQARFDFQETRDEMRVLAAQIARERNLPDSDYREVLRSLKKDQIAPSMLLATYGRRLRQIEDIIRREALVTLPRREASIRVATEAESAQLPSPYMNPPRLIGNSGEYGEFVIPLSNPNAKSTEPFDDNSFEGETWTLTAHEARPGHELQYASMVERGMSNARALFADNSANVEGWAVYCEAMILPYMPIEGQLASLQERLLRIARAFLDPMVNLGQITPERAKQFLMDEVVESEPMAQSEIDRYAFLMPGQATAYYFGYSRLRSLRTAAEIALGPRFELRAFNDFVIAQGLLPPAQMVAAVMDEFVPAALASAAAH